MDSPFMNTIAEGVARAGVRVVRFEFPYMRARRECGKKRPPDREPVLLQAYRDVIEKLGGGNNLVIGGKSLGGRIASMVPDQAGVLPGLPFPPAWESRAFANRASKNDEHSDADHPGRS